MSYGANERCAFYCLSYKNEERKSEMIRRFNQLNLDINFYDGVNFEDDRIRIPLADNSGLKKCWSYTYGHFDMINKSLNETDKEYGVFCEDDIYLHKELANDIPMLIGDFKTMELDVLLIGYLTTYKIEDYYVGFNSKYNVGFNDRSRKYHNYPDELWGAQMYMISRTHAKRLIDKYYCGYAEKSLNSELHMTPFSSDWIITKDGNRALVYPMYAVEDGKTHYDHSGQETYHQQSFILNYDKSSFV